MKIIINNWLFVFCMVMMVLVSSTYAANKFFDGDEKYRGFYWFEQVARKKANRQESSALTYESLSSKTAMKNMSERRKQLSDARNIMLELSYNGAGREEIYKAVQAYKRLENEMRDSGLKLALAWESVNFLNPEFNDRINNPVNVPANKLKRQQEKKQQAKQIREFADNYDLVLFEQENCVYCQQFKPVLRYFVSKYGFSLDVVGSGVEYSKLIEQLEIKAAPTLIAISKDGKNAFELIRGMATLSEIEENTQQAVSLIKSGYRFGLEG